MEINYRPIVATDIAALIDLRAQTRENAISQQALAEVYGVTVDATAAELQRGLQGWLAETDGRAVGFAMGDKRSAEVTVVAVLDGYEHRGIAKTLLSLVCQWLFRCGYAELWLDASPNPQFRSFGFYRHLGWRRNGQPKDDNDTLILSREAFEAA